MSLNAILVDDENSVELLFKYNFRKWINSGKMNLYFDDSAISSLVRLDQNEQNKINLVLLDVMMPGMDGFELLEKIKNDFPMVSVIMISANDSDEYIEKAKSLGALEYYRKPLDFNLLKKNLLKQYPFLNES